MGIEVYNKMVQMLECMSVQNSVGCHWKDWVRRNGTRLAIATDLRESKQPLIQSQLTHS